MTSRRGGRRAEATSFSTRCVDRIGLSGSAGVPGRDDPLRRLRSTGQSPFDVTAAGLAREKRREPIKGGKKSN
jgi:hypothetical protein